MLLLIAEYCSNVTYSIVVMILLIVQYCSNDAIYCSDVTINSRVL